MLKIPAYWSAETKHLIADKVRAKQGFFNKYFERLNHPLKSSIKEIIFATEFAERHYLILESLLNEDNCLTGLDSEDYRDEIQNISLDLPSSGFAAALRKCRNRHLLRLILREQAELSDTEESIRCWSNCADELILHTIAYCLKDLHSRYGKPLNTKGEKTQLYILAMGKLGGQELNYSSDIDLIFAFSETGQTAGPSIISNQEFYSKAVQQFIHLLQTITPDGFVFRVDLRLRPYGESGPVVSSLTAMETYYQEEGRDWERYAMIKARIVSKEEKMPAWFSRLIIPFVYRRYVDFSIIESLRSMKSMIEREVQLKPMLNDVKRGSGGIREIEFIIQSFQLIRGGRILSLQKQNAIQALQVIHHEKLASHMVVLSQAYFFMRKLENALQIHQDQQIHSLPTNPIVQEQVAVLMKFLNWAELDSKIRQYRRIITHAFRAVLYKQDDYEDEQKLLLNQLANVWQGHVESMLAINLFISLGYQNPERCYQMLYAFRHGPKCRRLSQISRLRLDRFMVILLNELKNRPNTDTLLLQFIHLLESIVGRSAYLALLTENPTVIQEVLYWFAHSPFISELLVNQPFLLEVLIDQNMDWHPLSKNKLQENLQLKLEGISADESDLKDEILRQFKLTHWLLAARAELFGHYSALKMGKFLTDVAETIINAVVKRALEDLAKRFPDILKIREKFNIVAYGKLGSREMNYNSDLDLVFLHRVLPSEEALVTRLTQKILHLLTTRTQSGILYLVDTRLRPSGSAGLLVSHLKAFEEYQFTQAWVWEHQAILRARVILPNSLRLSLQKLKRKILAFPREKNILRTQILEMREKIKKHLGVEKKASSELLDLEFLVQFLILAHADPVFAQVTNTLSQLNRLKKNQVISNTRFQHFKKMYETCHLSLHRALLQPDVKLNEDTHKTLDLWGSFLN